MWWCFFDELASAHRNLVAIQRRRVCTAPSSLPDISAVFCLSLVKDARLKRCNFNKTQESRCHNVSKPGSADPRAHCDLQVWLLANLVTTPQLATYCMQCWQTNWLCSRAVGFIMQKSMQSVWIPIPQPDWNTSITGGLLWAKNVVCLLAFLITKMGDNFMLLRNISISKAS